MPGPKYGEYFTVFTVDENREIMSEETVSSPANCACKSNISWERNIH